MIYLILNIVFAAFFTFEAIQVARGKLKLSRLSTTVVLAIIAIDSLNSVLDYFLT